MVRYVLVSIAGGILFGVLDGVIHGNPFAQRCYEVFKPIARTSINVPAGLAIDLAYGFVLTGVFLLLYRSLPGEAGLAKGMSFALLVWFFRVVMSVASQWMMFELPAQAVLYTLITGLAEMLVLGALFGITLKPST